MTDSIRLGGIKLSGELVQFDCKSGLFPDDRLLTFLHQCVDGQINIPHLHQGFDGPQSHTTLCISSDDFQLLQHCREVFDESCHRILPSVGTLSLFPHSFNFSLIVRILLLLLKHNIPIHGMSTSVSAVVLHTDFDLLDDAVEHILSICHLPENHTPLRPVVVLGDEEIETVAVYWEPQIKIYGLDIRKDLSEIQIASFQDIGIQEDFYQLVDIIDKFALFQVIPNHQGDITASILMEGKHQITGGKYGKLESLSLAGLFTTSSKNLELVSFHGPHFQDRYGIAEMALRRLKECDIEILRCGCTGTTVHFVVGEGDGNRVADCLDDTFIVP